MGIPGIVAMSAANRAKKTAELNSTTAVALKTAIIALTARIEALESKVAALESTVNSPTIGNVKLDARLKAIGG